MSKDENLINKDEIDAILREVESGSSNEEESPYSFLSDEERWTCIKNEYVTKNLFEPEPNVRDLALTFEISVKDINKRAWDENWDYERTKNRNKFLEGFKNKVDQAIEEQAFNSAEDLIKTLRYNVNEIKTLLPTVRAIISERIHTFSNRELINYEKHLIETALKNAQLLQAELKVLENVEKTEEVNSLDFKSASSLLKAVKNLENLEDLEDLEEEDLIDERKKIFQELDNKKDE